jgi:hypothetical protein
MRHQSLRQRVARLNRAIAAPAEGLYAVVFFDANIAGDDERQRERFYAEHPDLQVQTLFLMPTPENEPEGA